MSNAHAYDELGRILSRGGIRSAAHAAGAGLVGIAAVNWLMGRFPSLSRLEAGKLATLGRAYAQAGAMMTAGDPETPLSLGDIPLVPPLYGGDNLGRRIQYETRIFYPESIAGGSGVSTIFIDSAVVMTPSEIVSQATADMASGGGDKSKYERVTDWIANRGGQPMVVIVGAARAF